MLVRPFAVLTAALYTDAVPPEQALAASHLLEASLVQQCCPEDAELSYQKLEKKGKFLLELHSVSLIILVNLNNVSLNSAKIHFKSQLTNKQATTIALLLHIKNPSLIDY